MENNRSFRSTIQDEIFDEYLVKICQFLRTTRKTHTEFFCAKCFEIIDDINENCPKCNTNIYVVPKEYLQPFMNFQTQIGTFVNEIESGIIEQQGNNHP